MPQLILERLHAHVMTDGFSQQTNIYTARLLVRFTPGRKRGHKKATKVSIAVGNEQDQ